MLRNHVENNIGSVGRFVNSFVTVAAVAVILVIYVSAISPMVAA